MQTLLTANIFAQWTPAALIGAGLFGALLALPLFCDHNRRSGHVARDQAHIGRRGRSNTPRGR